MRSHLVKCGTLAAALASASVAGCGGKISFELSRDIPETNVDGDPVLNATGELLGGAPIAPFALVVDLQAELDAHDAGPVQEIHMAEVVLAVTDGLGDDDDDLSWISRADIVVESTATETTLPPVVVATATDFPPGATSVSFEVDSDVDLLPYVEEGVRMSVDADAIYPPDDVRVGGSVTLEIVALKL